VLLLRRNKLRLAAAVDVSTDGDLKERGTMFSRKLKRLKEYIIHWYHVAKSIRQLWIHQEIDRLRKSSRYQDQRSLIPFGAKVYSQNDEDGIIREIFTRIGVTNKVFIELGIGNGLENNTLALLFNGWKGLWIDSSSKSVNDVKRHFADIISKEYLQCIETFITKDNIDEVISSHIRYEEIDLLSIDIDGNDYHIFNAITCINPRVVVIEYNAKFTPPILFCVDYDESHVWAFNDCFGASLKFLEINFAEKGYCLVGCNITGSNSFFVRKDLVGNKFLEPFTAENHYEPARYHLTGLSSGHPASYGTLVRSFTMRRS